MEIALTLLLLALGAWALWWAFKSARTAPAAPDRVGQLESQVAQLTRRVWQLEHASQGTTVPLEPRPEIVLKPQIAVPIQVPTPDLVDDPVSVPAQPIPLSTVSWEARLGENWLLKIGALVLVIGVALLPTYSFGLLGPLGRTLMATALSALFLAGGIVVESQWLHFRRWAWGLIGVGWAGLYVTAFAAHSIEATRVIASPVTALLVMLAVAAAMLLHSLRYKDERVTGFTYFLAFAAFLLYRDQPIVLPAMSLLAVAALIVSWSQQWRWLVLGDLVLTYLAYVFLPGHAWVVPSFGDPILWLLWAMFETYDCLALKRGRAIPFALHLNAIGFVAASILVETQPQSHYGWYLTWATAAFALTSLIRWRIAPSGSDDSLEREVMGSGPTASLIVMSLTLTGAIFWRFDGLAETFALLLEGEFLFWMGTRSRQRAMRWMGVGVLLLFAIKLTLVDGMASYGTRLGWADLKAWVPLAAAGFVAFLGNRILLGSGNPLGIAFGVGASALGGWIVDGVVPGEWRSMVYGAAAGLTAQYAPRDYRYQALFSAYLAVAYFGRFTMQSKIEIPVGIFLAAVHWWIAQKGTLRVLGLSTAAGLLSVLIFDKAPEQWQVIGLLTLAVAMMATPRLAMAAQGVGVLWLVTVFFVFRDLDRSGKLLAAIPQRVVSGLPLILAHWLLGNRELGHRRVAQASQLGATGLIALLIAVQFDREWASIGWGVAGAGMLAIGFFSGQRWLRMGGLALFGLGVLKLFVYDLSSLSGLARILSFIVLGILLMAASWAYTKFKR